MKKLNILAALAALWLAATLLPALFTAGCQPGQLHQEDARPAPAAITVEVPPDGGGDTLSRTDPCGGQHTVKATICLDDNYNPFWVSLWDVCLKLHTQISWEPATGLVVIRSSVPLCGQYFEWHHNTYCDVPDYEWHVETTYAPGEGQFWEGYLTFPPDECLAEAYLACSYFRFRIDCPSYAASISSTR